MTDPATLNALASEVEAGTGPDRDLDARIEDLIGPESETPGSHLLGGFTAGRKAWLLAFSPRYTASVDAALALMGEVLPGWACVLQVGSPGMRSVASLCDPEENVDCGDGPVRDPKRVAESEAATPPLAILAAVLRAAARGEGA